MATQSGHSLSELLSSNTSLHIKTTVRGSCSTAAFRGTDASHTKVYWNGIRLNSAGIGQADLSQLPVWFIDDISLLYGGSSLAEGSGALGGSLILENTPGGPDKMNLSVSQEFASFGTFSNYSGLRLGKQRFQSDTKLFTTRSRNNYSYYNDHDLPHREEKLEHAGYLKRGLMQQFYIRPASRQQVSLHFWYQDAGRELPPVMSYAGTDRDETQSDKSLRSSLQWKYYTPAAIVSFRSGYSRSILDYHFSGSEYSGIDTESRTLENSLYNSLSCKMTYFEHSSLDLRVDANYLRVDSRESYKGTGYDRDRKEISLLGSLSRDLNPRLSALLLLRQDFTDGKFLPLMPSAGLSYKWLRGREAFLRLNLSRNYNMPSLSALYTVPGGNPGLLPENALQGDLGLDFKTGREKQVMETGLNVFASLIDDWILWRPNKVYSYWEPENIARVYSRGFEYKIKYRLELSDYVLGAGGSYSYTHTTNRHADGGGDASRGKQLVYVPAHQANAFVNASRSGYFLNLIMAFTGKRYTQSSNEEGFGEDNLEPYLLTDLYAGKDWGIRNTIVGLKFTVYNLFNVQYQAVLSRPMPGRFYSITFKFEI